MTRIFQSIRSYWAAAKAVLRSAVGVSAAVSIDLPDMLKQIHGSPDYGHQEERLKKALEDALHSELPGESGTNSGQFTKPRQE